MLRAKASLVRAVGSDIGRVFTRSFGRSWGVVKDLHFGWFVIVPVMSSAGSVTLGTALYSALWMAPSIAFLAALTFFGTSSLLNSRVIPRLTQHWSDRLLGLFAERLPRVFPPPRRYLPLPAPSARATASDGWLSAAAARAGREPEGAATAGPQPLAKRATPVLHGPIRASAPPPG